MFTFLRRINTHEGAKPKTVIKLFNSLVKPVFIYNSEVCVCGGGGRGAFLKPNKMRDLVQFSTYMFNESHFHETLQNKLCHYILDVQKKSSSLAVKGELGVCPISISIYTLFFSYRWGLNVLHPFWKGFSRRGAEPS